MDIKWEKLVARRMHEIYGNKYKSWCDFFLKRFAVIAFLYRDTYGLPMDYILKVWNPAWKATKEIILSEDFKTYMPKELLEILPIQ